MTNWIDFKVEKPKNRERVIVYYVNSYGKGIITLAEYIEPKTVPAEDFLNEEYSDDFPEYDEEKDCYWTPTGFYEYQFMADISWFISENISHWMKLPQKP